MKPTRIYGGWHISRGGVTDKSEGEGDTSVGGWLTSQRGGWHISGGMTDKSEGKGDILVGGWHPWGEETDRS